MSSDLKDKVALVTGASSGIGRATALALAGNGAKVVVSDLDRDGGEETVRLVRELGADAMFAMANVASPADAQSLVTQTVNHYGRLDISVKIGRAHV